MDREVWHITVLACKESDTTQRLNLTEYPKVFRGFNDMQTTTKTPVTITG